MKKFVRLPIHWPCARGHRSVWGSKSCTTCGENLLKTPIKIPREHFKYGKSPLDEDYTSEVMSFPMSRRVPTDVEKAIDGLMCLPRVTTKSLPCHGNPPLSKHIVKEHQVADYNCDALPVTMRQYKHLPEGLYVPGEAGNAFHRQRKYLPHITYAPFVTYYPTKVVKTVNGKPMEPPRLLCQMEEEGLRPFMFFTDFQPYSNYLTAFGHHHMSNMTGVYEMLTDNDGHISFDALKEFSCDCAEPDLSNKQGGCNKCGQNHSEDYCPWV